MAAHLDYLRARIKLVSNEIGVYALCDLDAVPVYVGQSEDGIRDRVRRHLTSARSDVIANRQVDVWEIAYVTAWPFPDRDNIRVLEAHLFHEFNRTSPLMNGSVPNDPGSLDFVIPSAENTQIMEDDEIATRREPAYRLPRQAEHFSRLVDHILNVKDSPQLRRALVAHFTRLERSYSGFLEG